MADIENIVDHGCKIQRNIRELIDHFEKFVKEHGVHTAVIIFRLENEEGALCIAAGSETRDYDFQEINWDLDSMKNAILTQEFDFDME